MKFRRRRKCSTGDGVDPIAADIVATLANRSREAASMQELASPHRGSYHLCCWVCVYVALNVGTTSDRQLIPGALGTIAPDAVNGLSAADWITNSRQNRAHESCNRTTHSSRPSRCTGG